MINVKGKGYKNRGINHWHEMSDKEKFIDCCEGIFTENVYGTNYLSENRLKTIMNISNLLLRGLKV